MRLLFPPIYVTINHEGVVRMPFSSKRQKVVSVVVFAVYLALLVWLVLFKFATNASEIPHLRGINWLPFHYAEETSSHASEVVQNILIFIPLGVYAAAFLPKPKGLALVPAFAVSLLFEVTQYVFSLGASDVTDLIGNTLGGMLGVGLFWLLGKITARYRMRVINLIGVAVEIGGIALLAVLLIANS